MLDFHDIMDGRVLVMRHGDGFLYETQHVTLTAVTTIPGTTYAHRGEQGLAHDDEHVTPNGDGTLTIKSISPARVVLLPGRSHRAALLRADNQRVPLG